MNTSGIGITEAEKVKLDKEFAISELYEALTLMKKGRAPGNDGLTVEFYLAFWEEIKDMIWKMYREVIHQGELGPSARRGLINLNS